MQALTSLGLLQKIVAYQDGMKHSDIKIQPDLVAKAGHMNLLLHSETFSATPYAYVAAMKQTHPLTIVKCLMQQDVLSDFVIGDEACKHGHIEVIKFVLEHADKNKQWNPFSFKGLHNTIIGGHLEALRLISDRLGCEKLKPAMLQLAVKHRHRRIVDWIYESSAADGSIPTQLQLGTLVYYIEKCTPELPAGNEFESRVIELLLKNPFLLANSQGTKPVDICASVGNLRLLHMLFGYRGQESHSALDTAAKNGHLSVVRYLTGDPDDDSVSWLETNEGSSDTEPQDPSMPLDGAGEELDDNYVYLLSPAARTRGKYTIHATNRAITEAAKNNHMAVVQYLATHRYEGCDSRCFDLVAAEGHLEVLQYLATHHTDIFPSMSITTDALDNAAANGHLSVVQYLSTRPEGCTTDAMDRAAANGHLGVLRWLHENRNEGCTTEAFDNAAGNNHLEVLEWLAFTRRREGGSARAIDLAATNGHLGILQWIKKHFHIMPTRLAYDSAAGNGHLEVLQFLLQEYTNLLSVATIELAARGGHVKVLQWLYDNFVDMFVPQYAECAPDSGISGSQQTHSPPRPRRLSGGAGGTSTTSDSSSSVGFVSPSKSNSVRMRSSKRLRTIRESNALTTTPLAEALSLAVRHGQCQVVQWLITRLKIEVTEPDIDWAARNGHLPMLLLIQQHSNRSHNLTRPTIKSLEWSILNGHMDVVHYLLQLSDNRLNRGYVFGSHDFNTLQAVCYAKRYGQEDMLLLLDQFSERLSNSNEEVSSPSSNSSDQVSVPDCEGHDEVKYTINLEPCHTPAGVAGADTATDTAPAELSSCCSEKWEIPLPEPGLLPTKVIRTATTSIPEAL